ncbi:MAG: class I SAM-dependent methyltransferase [Rickettsiales bacterium]|nr:class I SAM-dependent methyltransferase [Rickettsiales bacterium]
MNRKRIISLYNSIAKAYDGAIGTSEHIDEFAKHIKPKSRIIDIGCGPGNNAVYLSNLGHDVTGVDLSDEMLKLAKAKNSNANFIKQDIEKLDFPQNSFDCAVARNSLCCISKNKVPKCLMDIHKIINKDGFLFLGMAEGVSGEISFPETFDPKLLTDLNVVSQKEIEGLLQDAGFTVMKKYKEPDEEWPGINKFFAIAKVVKSR